MLFELMIENVALIKKLNVNFQQGLNILTGETGAGKSIIIDAVNIAIGERADKSLIRTGEEKATVQVVFYSNNLKVQEILRESAINSTEDGLIILTREIYSNGRSTSRINDKLVTASLIKEICKYLIDIHGQHSHQSLLYTENHIDMLDSYNDRKISELLKIYKDKYEDYKGVVEKIKLLTENDIETERKKDLLSYQIEEIENANLSLGEEEKLLESQILLSNTEKIFAIMASSYESINNGNQRYSSIIDGIGHIVNEIDSIKTFDKKINSIYEVLEDVLYRLQDVARDIRSYRDQIDFNPDALEQIEFRIDLINRLKRKYGKSIQEILEYKNKIYNDLKEIEDSKILIESLSTRLGILKNDILHLAKDISERRKIVAGYLEEKMNDELISLNMEKSTFKVQINNDVGKDGNPIYTSKGIDSVEFLISTNPGEPMKPLAKIASGGEMSRIMLAMKTILAKTDNIPTIIFDEIDTGISGRTANIVGEKLALLSKNHQILCITHLPQIACMADEHFFIEKNTIDNITITTIKNLNDSDKIIELAKLIGGVDITNLTLENAKEMICLAEKIKSKK